MIESTGNGAPRVATYRRTSLEKMQAERNGSAGQDLAINRWLCAQGIDPATCTEYVDEGKTGRDMKRPAFQRLMTDVRAGRVSCVVAYSLTRIGRSTRELLQVVAEFTKRKVRLVLVKESIDLDTPIGRLFMVILAGIAEFEADVISERVSSGIQARLAAGESWGGGKVIDPSVPGCAKLPREQWEALARQWRAGGNAESLAGSVGVNVAYFRRKCGRVLRQPTVFAPPANPVRTGLSGQS